MTTPDKEEMPADKAAGPWIVHYGEAVKIKDANGYTVASLSQIHLHGRRSKNEVEKTARFIVAACNAYEPMREALLAAKHFITNGIEFGFIRMPDRGDTAHNTLPMILAALSTLPVNDRHHSGSDNERLQSVADQALSKDSVRAFIRENYASVKGTDRQTSDDVGRLRALLVALDALIEQCRPLIAVDAFVLRDAIYEAQQARAALKSTDRQPSDDVGRLRDRLRELGYAVAVHNDYRINGVAHTFWLFTHPDGRWIKGEGETDAIALRAALKGVPQPATPKEAAMTEAQIKHMVDRFLMWKLPEHFNPDDGISFDPVASKGTPYEFRRSPSGTNLFSAEQATAMVRHMLDGLPQPASEAGKLSTDTLGEA